MDWNGCADVEVIPGKVSGVPLVKGSRVQADSVVESFLLGESVKEIAFDYSLDASLVESVLRFTMSRAVQVAA
ncbi:MAG: DUF433 domain-containing protein [Acidobacteriota bacterium]